MNGLSLSELCCLFCCPPCPSQIASKLAFLPPEPTYTFLPDLDSGSTAPGTIGHRATALTDERWKLHLTDRAEFQYSQRELDMTEVFLTRSSRGNKVACMYIRCAPNARFTVLFSHGNAVDLGQMSTFYMGLGTRINCNIFSYDYSGYGVSTGKPSEKNLYAEGFQTALIFLRTPVACGELVLRHSSVLIAPCELHEARRTIPKSRTREKSAQKRSKIQRSHSVNTVYE